jgi:hypothetical protein
MTVQRGGRDLAPSTLGGADVGKAGLFDILWQANYHASATLRWP